MQLRFATELTFDQYVKAQAWRQATLSECPICPPGQCHPERHGTYMRKVPEVAYVARFYCPTQGTTIGLLPDFYSSRMPGTLPDLEEVVARAERMPSLQAAANEIRPDDAADAVTLPSAIRWVWRRQVRVGALLVTVMGLLPALFEGCRATVTSFRARLQTGCALVALRGICERHLHALPAPLGLVPPPQARKWTHGGHPQSMGPDPPCQDE